MIKLTRKQELLLIDLGLQEFLKNLETAKTLDASEMKKVWTSRNGKPKKGLSPEGRRAISLAQKRRWAKLKRAKKATKQ